MLCLCVKKLKGINECLKKYSSFSTRSFPLSLVKKSQHQGYCVVSIMEVNRVSP